MADSPFDESTPFGKRAADRLRQDLVVWLTTVGNDGTPQPNPVWFLWDGGHEIHVWNATNAHRLRHVEARPQVSLNFDSDGRGSNIVVLRGRAAAAPDLPDSAAVPAYQAKYGRMISDGAWKTPEQFDRLYPHKLRITIEGVRGF